MPSKVTSLLLVFCLLGVLADGQNGITCAAQQEFFPFIAKVTAKKVNVRTGQSSNFESVCQLEKGEEVIVEDHSYSWYKIQLPLSAKSFIHEEYVQLLSDHKGGIIADQVNVRAGAGVKHTVLGQLEKGAEVEIFEYLDGWYRIKPLKDSFGWISDKFLSFHSRDIKGYQKAQLEKSSPKKEEKQEIQKESQVITEGPVVVVGTLKGLRQEHPDFQHRLVIDERTTYYLKSPAYILNEFLGEKVSVKGTLRKDDQEAPTYPIIIVSKIQLVL